MKICICDDDYKIVDQIEKLININLNQKYKYSLHKYYTYDSIIENVDNNFDIAFMDIELGDHNGIEASKKLLENNPDIIIIFISNYPEYVKEAFRIKTFQFLTKPIDENDFSIDFKRALKTYISMNEKVLIEHNGIKEYIFISDLIYVEINQKIISFHTKEKIICKRDSIKNYSYLMNRGFLRPHRSFLVNSKYVKLIGKKIVLLENCKETIPLSKNYKIEFVSNYNNLKLVSVI